VSFAAKTGISSLLQRLVLDRMADKVNPYRRWLGLAQAQPDFFQLLGIERGERRPEAIRAAAEARLEFLKSFPDEAGKPDRKQLSEEIKLAFKTLTQPDQREEYLKKSPAGSTSPAPLAMPIAVSLARPTTPPAIPSVQPLASVALATPVRSPEPETAGDPIAAMAQLGVQGKSTKSRRSKSWLVPAVSLGLFLGGPVVVLAIIWFNSNRDRIAEVDSGVKETGSKSQADKVREKPAASTASPFKGLLKQAAEPQRTEKAAGVETGANEQISAAQPEDDPKDTNNAVLSSSENPDTNSPAEQITSNSNYATPAVAEVFRSVWVDLELRNEDVARRRVVIEKGLLASPGETPQLTAAEEAIGLSEGFWKQVVSSCRTLKTGEIRFGDDIAMFVESTDQFVVLKLKGVLVKVQLAYLPKSVAIELAERGTINDIPSWRLQKSVALMLEPLDAGKNEQAIRELLSESARDGHGISNLEWLLQRRLDEATFASRRQPPDEVPREVAIKKLNEKIPDKQLAQNNIAGRNVVIQQLQAHVRQEQDADIRFVALERARKQTIKKADVVQCRQFVVQLGAEFEIDLEGLWLQSLEEMTDFVQTPQQAEMVCEAMIAGYGFGWPNFEAGSASEQKLSSAEDLARKYDLKMTLDRIRYLTGQK
jgi:hypothetical protein